MGLHPWSSLAGHWFCYFGDKFSKNFVKAGNTIKYNKMQNYIVKYLVHPFQPSPQMQLNLFYCDFVFRIQSGKCSI